MCMCLFFDITEKSKRCFEFRYRIHERRAGTNTSTKWCNTLHQSRRICWIFFCQQEFRSRTKNFLIPLLNTQWGWLYRMNKKILSGESFDFGIEEEYIWNKKKSNRQLLEINSIAKQTKLHLQLLNEQGICKTDYARKMKTPTKLAVQRIRLLPLN